MEHEMLSDLTVWLYLAIVIISGAGCVLFVANWVRLGTATRVYKYVTFLLLGHAIKQSVELYSIWVRESGDMLGFLNLIHSWFWDFRLFFVIVPLAALVGKMYWRTFVRIRSGDGKEEI